jgi:putative ATP-dependent endonuclease of OLD family
VPVDNVVVLRSNLQGEGSPIGTVAIPIAQLAISDAQRAKVSRFLDATKASLLFARRIILVEGLAELILLPSIARQLLVKGGRQPAAFSGVTVIAVGGVDFEPYVRLLLTKHNGVSILDSVVIITDRDPSPVDGSVAVDRVKLMEELAAEIENEGQARTFASQYTLEADLAGIAANLPLLKQVYLLQHPLSGGKWTDIETSGDPAKEFHRKLATERAFIGKGEFAQELAARVVAGDAFTCPTYIEQAIVAALPPEPEGQDEPVGEEADEPSPN